MPKRKPRPMPLEYDDKKRLLQEIVLLRKAIKTWSAVYINELNETQQAKKAHAEDLNRLDEWRLRAGVAERQVEVLTAALEASCPPGCSHEGEGSSDEVARNEAYRAGLQCMSEIKKEDS
jgi:hypothetical protein